jgi:hypothetical protein
MSETPSRDPNSRHRSDRWSGRKTLVFIVVASLLLWALIALIIHAL